MKLAFPLPRRLTVRHWCRLDLLSSLGLDPVHDPLREVLESSPGSVPVSLVVRRPGHWEATVRAASLKKPGRTSCAKTFPPCGDCSLPDIFSEVTFCIIEVWR